MNFIEKKSFQIETKNQPKNEYFCIISFRLNEILSYENSSVAKVFINTFYPTIFETSRLYA